MAPVLALLVGLMTGSACQPYDSDVYGQVDGVDGHGVLIASNGTGITGDDITPVVEATWDLWHAALYRANVACHPMLDGVYLSLSSSPIERPWGDGVISYAGLTEDHRNAVWGGGYIVMSVRVAPAWQEHLAHELGHVVLVLCHLDRPLDPEGTLLDWATEYGVPY